MIQLGLALTVYLLGPDSQFIRWFRSGSGSSFINFVSDPDPDPHRLFLDSAWTIHNADLAPDPGPAFAIFINKFSNKFF